MIWDRLPSHRARVLHRRLRHRPDLHAEFLPPYAPELNRVEYLWEYLKSNPLANVALIELDPLARMARGHGRRLQRDPSLLRSFLAHSPLFFVSNRTLFMQESIA